MKRVSASCPGSCGELFQCVIGTHEVLLSYGIDKRVTVTLMEGEKFSFDRKDKGKLLKVLDEFSQKKDYQLLYRSSLPVGKGYSSSTADLVATLGALSLYQGRSKKANELTRDCARIEPTDSVAFPTWTVMNPLSGEIIWQTDWRPDLYVYILEPRQEIKTLDVVRMLDSEHYPKEESAKLLPLFKQACQQKSLSLLGKLATRSAILNDRRLPKPYLQDILHLMTSHDCLGVNVAHSGSLVGILLTKQQAQRIHILEKKLADSEVTTYYQKRCLHQVIYEGVKACQEEIY